jgi:hypothetical protein
VALHEGKPKCPAGMHGNPSLSFLLRFYSSSLNPHSALRTYARRVAGRNWRVA